MCAWHGVLTEPGESQKKKVRRYRTEGQHQQGKGNSRNGLFEGSMR